MKTRLCAMVALGSALALQGWGQAPVITGFQPGGQLSWSNRPDGVVEYRVQSAESLAPAVWTNEQIGIVSTSSMMSVTVPSLPGDRYSRIAAVTNLTATSDSYLVVDLSGGTNAANYPVSYLSTVPDGGWSDEYKTTKMVFRRIPAGTFTMGSPTNELGRYSGETQHQVTLTQPFYIGVFIVTQKQWERVVGNWPSWSTNVTYRDARPVEYVSYEDIRGSSVGTNWPTANTVDAASFMGLLRARTGMAFDLPTEAQWEYAGRAGTVSALNSGYNLTNTDTDAHMDAVGRYWHNGGSAATRNGDTTVGTATVGSYQVNAWGLYDIHGNAWQWCLDRAGDYTGAVSDPRGAEPSVTSGRIFRGGGYGHIASWARSAFRNADAPTLRNPSVGFRLVLPPGQ